MPAEGGEEALDQVEARHPTTALDAGHRALTRPGPIRQLLLGEPSDAAFPTKQGGDLCGEPTTFRHPRMMMCRQ
ncbi:hypothetical protein TPA0907_62890 [Micromonospora humidisoli]|nr:hypothetical protein TPA0907_62890 [Micromonospora sp. AKA109]